MWLFASSEFFVFYFVQTEQRSNDWATGETSFASPHGREKRNWTKFELPLMKKDNVSNIVICGICGFDKG